MTYKVALIGLGNIGYKFGKDASSNSSLSHYSAYDSNPSTQVIAGYTPDEMELNSFENATGIKGYRDLNKLFEIKPDIVSICSPTENHIENLELCLNNNIPMIWLEKPIASKIDSINSLRQNLKSMKQPPKILVNFFRRYHSGYIKLRRLIKNKTFGELTYININYSKGLLNNGLHMLDMIPFLFNVSSYEVIWKERISERENPSFILEADSGLKIYVHGTNTDYHNIDITVTTQSAKLSIIHGGMTVRVEKSREHELFPGFYRLSDSDDESLGSGGFMNAFDLALTDLIDCYEKNSSPNSNLETAYFSHQLLETVISDG